mmetsp:Transcript_25144/g.35228  ORF Transcript_25144/g.35228 Transcript_25144/m.35228 type:complete len:251 (+) Transcript_25144:178-930(+)
MEQELISKNADIICLQEVDRFDDFFQPILKPLGFEGIWKKKISNFNKDGVALFWNTNLIELIKHEFYRFDNDNQVAIISLMKIKNTEIQFALATTHLKAATGFDEQRLKQGHELTTRTEHFLHTLGIDIKTIPVIITGDFNDYPISPVIQFMLNGKTLHTDNSTKSLSHNFTFQSAYKSYDNSGKEPWTTYKKRAREILETIDYIFYTPHKIQVKQLLEIPDVSALPNRMPSDTYPSDHIAIMAELAFLN